MEATIKFSIPWSELYFTFSRSGGKGGQNVNKVSSKVCLHWALSESQVFSEAEKIRIASFPGVISRLNKEGRVVIVEESDRSQLRNRENAVKKLYELLKKALKVPKKRKPTKISYASKTKRLEAKNRNKQRKEARKVRLD